jgi:antitoxin component of MazEF toxin-antitoxin module
MIKTISKIGNSQGIIFDAALLDMARLKVGDQVDVTVHDGGAIVLTPLKRVITADDARKSARKLIRKNSEVFRRLS